MHGLYRGEPKIDFDRLAEIRSKVNVPLVLHGGSDLSEAIIERVIDLGLPRLTSEPI